jgi:hypothetical protein
MAPGWIQEAADRAPLRREYIQFPPFGPEHLANSLRHLAELVRVR